MYKFSKIKSSIIPIFFLLFTVGLVLFSSTTLYAAKEGLQLWANSVVPSLLPFFIATELLCSTNIIQILGNMLNKFMKPLFNVRGEGSFALIMGIISGYPTGAKIASTFRKDGICTKEECERLLSFTNNSGPLFIIGTVGISMFGNTAIGVLLFITHLLASLTVGFIFRFWKRQSATLNSNDFLHKTPSRTKKVNFFNLGEIIGTSITNSISTILMIGGYVVLFSVIISILKASNFMYLLTMLLSPTCNLLGISHLLVSPIFMGLLEITNGISAISAIHLKAISVNVVLTSFLLGFGGFSVMLQVFSIIAKTDLSKKPYVIGKILHGIIAAIYTYIFIYIFPFFNFDL